MKLNIPRALALFAVVFLFMLYSAPVQAFSKDQVERYSFAKNETGQAVYTLSFVLGGYSKDLYIPVVGERGLVNGTRENRFGFEIQSGYPSGVTKDGTAVALMISKAEVVDGHYKIPAGEAMSFKIISLLTIDETESNTYQFKVTELPFFVGEERETQSFNPSELKYMHSTFEALRFLRDTE